MKTLAIATALLLCTGAAIQAGVTRFSVESRTPYPANPKFELLKGHFYGTLDPSNIHNKTINDLPLAVRDDKGKIAYAATFTLLKPLDLDQASGVLIYDVANRGKGDVSVFANGHISLVSGWQGDLPSNPSFQTIDIPIARNRDGSPIRGLVFAQFFDMPPGQNSLVIQGGPIGAIGGRNFVPATDKGARLFRQSSEKAPLEPVSSADWTFADCTAKPFPGTPDLKSLCLRGGFDPKFGYTLSFQAQDPKILGIGYAATRDLIAFLRGAKADTQGNPNPVYGHVRRTIGRGSSQAGNFLRSFVHLGFNAAEDGQKVFDGMDVRLGVRQLPMDFRFSSPGGTVTPYEPGSEGPMWWTRYTDRTRKLPESSLLDRCNADQTCPKIIEEFGSAEFWGLRASTNLVGTDAKTDLPLPDNVRRYFTSSTTHGGGRGGFPLESKTVVPGCILPGNPNPASDTYNAVLEGLIGWLLTGAEPPASVYPTLAAGDLVAPNARAMGFPHIPGKLLPDGHLSQLIQYDFGPGFNRMDLTGTLDRLPPGEVQTIPILVPRVDADGNELSGIRSVQLQAPLGTYVGWNEIAKGFEAGQGCGYQGGFIPFAATKAQRLAAGDPRLSLEERYSSHDDYVAKVKAAADGLVKQRYLLAADAERLIRQAEDSKVLK